MARRWARPMLEPGAIMPDLETLGWAVLLTVWQAWTFVLLARGQRAKPQPPQPAAS